ncbi:hypothetical protein PF010_g11809 [Phytophthora fragariae]|uniref:Uncharacterized protein n=1 Tax=Phytophthora fragariae TaxID=53985 RepID=A0A6G0L5R0_9STRA|nr:hypothetical protein PF010_g11809 [Phytophthora fragariae]
MHTVFAAGESPATHHEDSAPEDGGHLDAAGEGDSGQRAAKGGGWRRAPEGGGGRRGRAGGGSTRRVTGGGRRRRATEGGDGGGWQTAACGGEQAAEKDGVRIDAAGDCVRRRRTGQDCVAVGGGDGGRRRTSSGGCGERQRVTACGGDRRCGGGRQRVTACGGVQRADKQVATAEASGQVAVEEESVQLVVLVVQALHGVLEILIIY